MIEEIGEVRGIEKTGTGILLTINSNIVLEGTKVGDSISIDGACLTVTAVGSDSFIVFASRVTCSATTLGDLKTGRGVNLERALQINSRLGGHLVQGHVDGRGRIGRVVKDENGLEIEISVEKDVLRYIVGKGSVAVDGISLTVVTLTGSGFTVYIIPETVVKTTLSVKTAGDDVNIETDILAKYIEKMLSVTNGKGDDDKNLKNKLIEEGFV